MTGLSTRLALMLAMVLWHPTVAAAEVERPSPHPFRRDVEKSPTARLELRAELQSLFHFKNDADFDRTAPAYDEDGQTVGAFATILTPRLTLRILDNLRIHYEVELGLNYWSKQDPDQQDPTAADIFVLKQREIYGEGELSDGVVGFKVGYAHFRDPTGLFVAHWIGVAQAWVGLGEGSRLGLFVGQVPDQAFEGILLDENNFRRDIWVFGGQFDLWPGGAWGLSAALTGLHDSHVVDQTRWVLCPSIHAELSLEWWRSYLDLALQAGHQRGLAAGGEHQTIVSWAAQGGVDLAFRHLSLRANLLALSPDDAHQGNRRNHAFLSSAKNRSATLLLTEDEIRDWYVNLDEQASGFRGGFFENRAGLLVGDLSATLLLHDRLRPRLIVGAASVLKPQNALDGTLVGVEIDAVLEVRLLDYLVGHVVVGGLIPGGAGAALVNRIAHDPKDPMVMTEVSLTLTY